MEIFDEVLKRLNTIASSEIRDSSDILRHDFLPTFITFEFNVYVNGQGRLNHKTKRSHVWHKLVTPPNTLRDEIDEVIQWVKSVDGPGTSQCAEPHRSRPTMTELPFFITRSSQVHSTFNLCSNVHMYYFTSILCTVYMNSSNIERLIN